MANIPSSGFPGFQGFTPLSQFLGPQFDPNQSMVSGLGIPQLGQGFDVSSAFGPPPPLAAAQPQQGFFQGLLAQQGGAQGNPNAITQGTGMFEQLLAQAPQPQTGLLGPSTAPTSVAGPAGQPGTFAAAGPANVQLQKDLKAQEAARKAAEKAAKEKAARDAANVQKAIDKALADDRKKRADARRRQERQNQTCFTGDTMVTMFDGTRRKISEVNIGDELLGMDGMKNTVLEFDHPKLGTRALYSMNGSEPFVTAEHPFMTKQGWKSFDPRMTAEEIPELRVDTLGMGDMLERHADQSFVKLEAIVRTSADPETQLYNFKLDGNHTYFANDYLVHNKSCFTADTPVAMYDGTIRRISDVEIGDELLGMDGVKNTVVEFDHPKLGDRMLYSINGSEPFVTAEHPFMTRHGWKSFDPEMTADENPDLRVDTLSVGDLLEKIGDPFVEIESVTAEYADPETQLYNFKLDGNNTYYAADYLVHNKAAGGGGGGGGGGCFAEGTEFIMADGSLKNVEDITIGDDMLVGGVVTAVVIGDGNKETWYDLFGIQVTSDHPVFDNGRWYRAEDAPSRKEGKEHPRYYSLMNEEHLMIAANGTRFTDYDEVDHSFLNYDKWLIEKLNERDALDEAGGFE